MAATHSYALFDRADRLGKTVRDLLTGLPGPLTNMELYLCGRWQMARARLEQQQRRGL